MTAAPLIAPTMLQARILAELQDWFDLCDWMLAALIQEDVAAVREALRGLIADGEVVAAPWTCGHPSGRTGHSHQFFRLPANTDARREARRTWEESGGDPMFTRSGKLRPEWRGQRYVDPPPPDPDGIFCRE